MKTRLFAALGAMAGENISEFTIDLKTHLAAIAAAFMGVGHVKFLPSDKEKPLDRFPQFRGSSNLIVF